MKKQLVAHNQLVLEHWREIAHHHREWSGRGQTVHIYVVDPKDGPSKELARVLGVSAEDRVCVRGVAPAASRELLRAAGVAAPPPAPDICYKVVAAHGGVAVTRLLI